MTDVSQDLIAIIIGTKEIELVALRVEVDRLRKRNAELEKPCTDNTPKQDTSTP